MEFIDLSSQKKRIAKQLERNIRNVFEHGKYIMGPEVGEVEKRLAEFSGVRHGIACASGTDALLMALMALNVGPGDAVITTPFTFISTAEVVSLLGATPVFVDIDPGTYNIDPKVIETAIIAINRSDASIHPLPRVAIESSLCPKVIIGVDLFGLPADYDNINEIAKKYNITVIEDAAQSFGSKYKGNRSCSLTDIGCTSFFPAKPLGGYGDGGMCFTDNDDLAEVMRSIRVHGKGSDKYDNIRIGINGRLDTIQAAILLAKFDIFPEEIDLRNIVSARYSTMLSVQNHVTTPKTPKYYESVWAQYSVLAETPDKRLEMQKQLKEKGIPTAVYYPKPLHKQTAFKYLQYEKGAFPISDDISTRIFSLPMHPYMEEADQKDVVFALDI